MALKRAALIKDEQVVNVILLDTEKTWTCPEGHTTRDLSDNETAYFPCSVDAIVNLLEVQVPLVP